MKKVKKILSLVLGASVLMTSLIGCGGSSSTSSSTSSVGFDTSKNITIFSREDGSGTRGAFIELFGIEQKDDSGKKVDKTTDKANIVNSTAVILTSVASDDYGIGYISLGSLNDSVKALKIDGAEPTAENVENGSYKISRPFNIVLDKSKENDVVNDFIDYIMSKDGQKIVTDNGYIAVSDKEYTSKKPSGKIVVGGSTSVSPVMEKLVEAYKGVNENATIEIQTTDSTTGISSVSEGTYNIGMASRDLKDSEKSDNIENMVIAKDGIAVVVNKNNTISNVKADDIMKIYTGELTTWDKVGK